MQVGTAAEQLGVTKTLFEEADGLLDRGRAIVGEVLHDWLPC